MSIKVRKYRWKKADGSVIDGWQVDINVLLPDGTPCRDRRKAPVDTKNAAQRWAEERLAFLLKNGGPERSVELAPTLEDFADTFLNAARGDRQKASTIYAKESILDAHLKPLLGKKRLDEIGPAEVQELKVKLKEHKPKTVNNVLAVLSKLLKLAHEMKKIPEPPGKLGMLRVEQDEAAFYDFGVYAQLVAGAEKEGLDALLVVLLAGDAGLREGEILALQRTDLDFPRGIITVRRADWNGVIGLPKGNKLRRVPMTRVLKAALERSRHLKGPLVLCKPDGQRLTSKLLGGMVRRAERRANLEATGLLHVLRHTFCSHLAMRGATAKAIQELAGHVHLTTTMRYMHLSPAAKSEAIALLDSRPSGTPTAGTPVECEDSK